jgi:hypothetical protein
MRHLHPRSRWLNHGLLALVALATYSGGNAQAAESNKIHVLETKYGDFLSDKTCVPDLSRCEGTAKCVVPPKDYACKSGAKPGEIQLKIIWDCGDFAHAAGHGAGPDSGRKTYTLTCPYIPNLNP